MKKIIIAIDGPAASGKSTTARRVAERLGYLYIDTGAMYRAITWRVLNENIDPSDEEEVSRIAEKIHVRLEKDNSSLRVLVDGKDVTREIRLPEVTKAASAVSSIPSVREVMVREQRFMGVEKGVVLEGRDIGTVVFPQAELKIFMVAIPRVRAERRAKELLEQGISTDVETLENEIVTRDRKDSTRQMSPLRKADDAIELDTSFLGIEEQVDFVLARARDIIENS
ncbi:MAG: (d)CMP kinase [Bacteroidota bacterium]